MEKIDYAFAPTPLGEVLVAASARGVCALFFVDSRIEAMTELEKLVPGALFAEGRTPLLERALGVFEGADAGAVPLDLRGTPFQMEVWRALKEIPRGGLATYGEIAARVGRPKACRAAGSAVGANPVSVIVPCHRVVRAVCRGADGRLHGPPGDYRWGKERKQALLKYELEGDLP